MDDLDKLEPLESLSHPLIRRAIGRIRHREPDRVFVEGEIGVTPRAAREAGMDYWRLALIRDDGWTIGVLPTLDQKAHALWSDRWIAFMEMDDLGRWQLRHMSFWSRRISHAISS